MATDTIDKESQKEFFKLISKHSGNLTDLIEDMLTSSLIDNKQLKLNKKDILIYPFVQDILAKFESFLTLQDQKNIVFEITVKENDRDLRIRSDASRLKQIILKLLSNAWKFSNEGTISIGFELKEKSKIQFHIKDQGQGIKEEVADDIFTKFTHTNENYIPSHGGTGLGLPITKDLVELLGGELWYQSEVNKGTCFYFTLPFKKECQSKTKEKPISSTEYWPDKKILIAEDDNVYFQYLNLIISQNGIQIIRAKNGVEAIELFKQHPDIALILMDLDMPEINGFQALASIRKENKHIPVIAQTASEFAQIKDEYIRSEFNEYIYKPINKKALIKTLNRYLS